MISPTSALDSRGPAKSPIATSTSLPGCESPRATEPVDGVGQRNDEVVPARVRRVCRNPIDGGARRGDQRVDRRTDVLRTDLVEVRQPGEIEQRIDSQSFSLTVHVNCRW